VLLKYTKPKEIDMKTIYKIILSLLVVGFVFAGCDKKQQPAEAEAPVETNTTSTTETAVPEEPTAVGTVSEASLGLRKTDLYSEQDTSGDATTYGKEAAGASKTIDRAFQDAPPMIPHDVEGMLPIKIGSNMCMDCHMPEVAEAVKATPVPQSHLTDFRPKTGIAKDGRITKNGKAVDNTSSQNMKYVTAKKHKTKLTGARYNCSQCHAPQSKGGNVPENNFKADFQSEDGASRSSLSNEKLMEGIDTLK
jgi:cytochrome c-type protein NapB